MSKSTRQTPKQAWNYETHGRVDHAAKRTSKRSYKMKKYKREVVMDSQFGPLVKRVPADVNTQETKVSGAPDKGYRD